MALYTTTKVPTIATADIIAYKILIKNKTPKRINKYYFKYKTPFRFKLIRNNNLILKPKESINIRHVYSDIYAISSSRYIHGILELNIAKQRKKQLDKYISNLVIVMCLILRNTKYFISMDDIYARRMIIQKEFTTI